MRKILLLTVLMVAMCVTGQTVVRRKTIRNINFGVLKLERIVSNNDTTYAMWIKTDNRLVPSFTVSLGGKDEAIRQLQFLIGVELKNDDMVIMDNAQHTRVQRGMFGSLRFFSEGEAFDGDCAKMYLQKFLDTIKEDNGMLVEDEEADEKPKKKKKRKVPAYMRNYDE